MISSDKKIPAIPGQVPTGIRRRVDTEKISQRARLILPNSFTFSYKAENFTACQHDILILIFEKLQGFMTNRIPLDAEMVEEQKVTIDSSEIMDSRNKGHVLQAAVDLMELEFGFRYIRDDFGNANRVWGVFVTTVEDIKGTSLIRLTINRDIFPVLTYYGESVGGTFLLKEPALETKGRHTKTIRNMLISRKGLGQFREDLTEFKKMLGLAEQYKPSCLRKDILEPVRHWLHENSDIWFEYELLKEKVRGRKSKSHAIHIWIYSREDRYPRKASHSDYSIVHAWVQKATGDPAAHRNVTITDSISESGRIHSLVQKILHYKGQVNDGAISMDHAVNIFRKILLEDFGIDCRESTD